MKQNVESRDEAYFWANSIVESNKKSCENANADYFSRQTIEVQVVNIINTMGEKQTPEIIEEQLVSTS